jgi:hypothetical protein
MEVIMKVIYAMFAFLLLFGCSGSDKSDDDILIRIPDTSSYMVFFDANGGEFNINGVGRGPNFLMPEFGIYMNGELRTPIKQDFQFSHWNSERDGSGIDITFINSSGYGQYENIIMYAQWTPLNGDYNVVLEPRMPDNLKIIKNLEADSVINMPDGSDYVMEGYTLLGWVDPETSMLYTDTYQVKKTATLFAVWERDILPDKCGLMLNATGGRIPSHRSGAATTTYPCGLINLRDLPEAEREGHVLKGWRSSLYDKNGGFFYPYSGSYKLEARSFLYAVWEKE